MAEKTEIVEKRVKSTIIRRRVVEKPESPKTPVAQVKQDKEVEKPATTKLSAETKKAEVTPIQAQEISKKEEDSTKQPGLKVIKTIELPKDEKSKPVEVETPVFEDEDDEEEKKKPKYKKVVKKKERLEVDQEEFGRISTISQIARLAAIPTVQERVERVFKPSKGGRKKKIISKKGLKKTQITQTKAIKRIVEMGKMITVGELSRQMGIKSGEIIKKLMEMGTMATVNQPLDFETAQIIATEYQFEVKDISFNENKIFEKIDQNKNEQIKPRPPVVTVMGHVDHGKTSLLDAIREANVTAGEAGGITQHIGAYTVDLPKGKITFLDTPGHEAFSQMRARGAKATDIVILVVAADDGVMPQTIESIDHAKAAGVPIVVAVNKIDKPDSNKDKIMREVSEKGLIPEDWGGDTMFCMVSAKEKKGIQELLESVLLQAEVLELKADQAKVAKGIVLEARLDKSRGPVATVLIQEGILKLGDIIVAGGCFGRIRAMKDHVGQNVDEAHPSHAVEVLGLDGVPGASESFNWVSDEQVASEIVSHRQHQTKQQLQASRSKISLEDFFKQSQDKEIKELKVILKADVFGSLEAISDSLQKLSTEKVKLTLVHSAVGGINESDILLASASEAIVIGFNVRPETKALSVAKIEGVDVKTYKIIYEMVNEIKLAMEGLLEPDKKENYLGRAEVRDTFTVSKVGTIAGCYVIDGKITRNASIRLLRDSVVIHEGEVSSLKRFKDDAREVTNGFECGISFKDYQDIKPGDLIEAFQIELIRATL